MQVKKNYKFPHKIYSKEEAELERYKEAQKRRISRTKLIQLDKIHPSLVNQDIKDACNSILNFSSISTKAKQHLYTIGYKRLAKITNSSLLYKIKNQSMDIGFFQAIILMPEKTFEILGYSRNFIENNTIDTRYLSDLIKKVEEHESKKITITLKHTITESIVLSPGYSNFTKDESQRNLPKPKKPQRSETADIWLIIKQFLMGVATGFFIGSGIIFIALVMKQIINRIENHDFLAR